MATSSSLSDAEAAAYEKAYLKTNDKDRRDGGSRADVERAYNAFFWDSGTELARVNGQKRTSLIVDPPDGQIPRADAPKRRSEFPARDPSWGSAVVGPDDPENAPPFGLYENPEERPLAERCLLAFGSSSGPPMLPIAYNNHYQIVQTPGYVMILVEMVHDVRMIPTDGRAARQHPPLAGRFGRPLGRRHAGRRHDQFQAAGQLPRLVREPARHRALHQDRREHDPLQVHDRRSDDVDEAVERRRSRCGRPTSGSTSTPATRRTTGSKACCAARGRKRSEKRKRRSRRRIARRAPYRPPSFARAAANMPRTIS